MDKEEISIAAVVVTYNRLEKLKKTLLSYERQVRKPDYLIVVNNASTDGTATFLQQFRQESILNVTIVNTERNLGGSGGFYLGEEAALKTDADWIMIADDDLYVGENYIEGLVKRIHEHEENEVAIICGAVEERGKYSSVHRSKSTHKLFELGFHEPVGESAYKKEVFKPDFVSYLAIMINRIALEKAGLVQKDFFIWNDDTEHVFRLKKYGKILCYPQYLCYHDVDKENSSLSWKNYYGYRNTLYFYREHYKLLFPIKTTVFIARTLLSFLRGHTVEEVRLRFAAIKDAWIGKLGENTKYKPGWKPSRIN